jgi:hypothetical protein
MQPWAANGGPSDEKLRELLDQGLTQKEIGERYGVRRQTVGYWVKRAGLSNRATAITHKDYLPWNVRDTDHHDSIARALRWYSTLQQGGELDYVAKREVQRLLDFLKARNVVVNYDRDRGFFLVPRKPGVDKATDIIRRPREGKGN